MQITNEFTLSLPPAEAYCLLLDLEKVTPCMPGATLGGALPDGSRAVNVTVKLGPMRFTYDGTVTISEQDDATRRAVLLGAAKEARGQGSAQAAIAMQVYEAPGGSRVTAVADVELTGRAAQMGHGMVESVSKQLIGQFTRRLSERYVDAGGDQAAPAGSDVAGGESDALEAGSLVWAVMRDRVSQPFRRRERGSE